MLMLQGKTKYNIFDHIKSISIVMMINLRSFYRIILIALNHPTPKRVKNMGWNSDRHIFFRRLLLTMPLPCKHFF